MWKPFWWQSKQITAQGAKDTGKVADYEKGKIMVMRKKRWILACIPLLLFPVATAQAADTKKTEVAYDVSEPTYEVLIPLDAEIPYQETSYYYGKIAVKEALLERDKCIQVTLDYDGNMKNEEHPEAKIPYRILAGDVPFTSQTYTKAGEETELHISISEEDWDKAAGGSYQTVVRFKIAYVDKQ